MSVLCGREDKLHNGGYLHKVSYNYVHFWWTHFWIVAVHNDQRWLVETGFRKVSSCPFISKKCPFGVQTFKILLDCRYTNIPNATVRYLQMEKLIF